MSKEVQISVVMSVFNEFESLPETLDSVLCQDGVNFEFIVVNDGSSDGSLAVLKDHAARDKRLKILNQENRGLTRSLIRGCKEGQGQFIARQDAGDISLPCRLKIQLAAFEANPDAVMVSCGTRFKGPEGEHLYQVQQTTKEADAALHSSDPEILHGPSHHGSTMFRRKAYLQAGGYRSQFKVAQDLDLWTRLVELGRHEVVQEILYETVLRPGCISSRMRRLQAATTEVIAECIRLRAACEDDGAFVEQISLDDSDVAKIDQQKADAEFCYFIASCLRGNNPSRSKHYLIAALKKNPFHLKALIRSVQARIRA
jgi:glycosyltransferase involved in cell wall biosynthesis